MTSPSTSSWPSVRSPWPLVLPNPQQLLPSLSAGIVTGLIGVIRAISYATLIFSGSLAPYLPTGVGLTVVSSAIACGVVALTSSLPGMIATPLAAPTAIIAMMAARLAGELQGEEGAVVVATIVAAIALSSLLTGLLFLALGLLKWGSKIRIIPYPVVGGFMAGTGWLLVQGFMQMSTDVTLTWQHLGTLLSPAYALRWLPGFGCGLILLAAARRWKHFLVLPGTLLLLALGFYGLLALTHTSIATARADGWLLDAFPEGDGHLWHPLSWGDLGQVHWGAVAHQGDSILTIMLVSLLSLTLSNSGIELVVGQDLSLNHELKALGWASLLAGTGSGMVGNQAVPSTLLVHNIGAKSRLTGLVAVLPNVAVLVLGSSFLPFLPEPVLASLLLYLGLSLLLQWVIEARSLLPLEDYLTVLITLVMIHTWGFLQGIGVGFVVTVITFMYHYSRVDVAKTIFSGFVTRSNVINRSPIQREILTDWGGQVLGVELQGFLFFGTAHYLLTRVRDRARPPLAGAGDRLPLRYVIFDFRQVTGLDSSAVLTFNKILKLARKQDLRLLFTNIQPQFQERLAQGEGFEAGEVRCLVFPDIDRGLEWCENQILSQAQALSSETKGLADRLAEMFLRPDQVQTFMDYLMPEEASPGQVLLQGRDPSKGLYFLETGQVTVLFEGEQGKTRRLQTCQGGSILGEMRFFGKVPLSTAVVADLPCRLYYLSMEALDRLKAEHPPLVYALEEYIVRLLCDSLTRREEQLRVMR